MNSAFLLTSRSTEATEEGSYRRTEVGSYRLDSGWTALASRREKEIQYTGHPFDSGSGLWFSASCFFFFTSGFGSSSRRSPICAIHFRSRVPWFALVSRVVSALFLECGLKLIQAGSPGAEYWLDSGGTTPASPHHTRTHTHTEHRFGSGSGHAESPNSEYFLGLLSFPPHSSAYPSFSNVR
jgi:hypothetical protein